MRSSMIRQGPIVTLLSSSTRLSRRVQAAVQSLFQLEPSSSNVTDGDDQLDGAFQSILPGFSERWDSVSSICPTSRTVLHFLSIDGAVDKRETEKLELLSIASSSSQGIQESRDLLAEQVSANLTRLSMKRLTGQSLSVHDLIGIGGGLPLIGNLEEEPQAPPTTAPTLQQGLKEIAVPHYDDATYPDGSSLITKLSESPLKRRVTGLYQFSNMNTGLTLRPLPSAQEDRRLSAPSLVFTCASLEETLSLLREKSAITQKIGFSGSASKGQFMVAHPDIPSVLDLRITDVREYSSSFAEAQEALLAASLPELQNENVLGGSSNGRTDRTDTSLNGLGDCWIEFRANIKNASGFLKRNPKAKAKVAKAPEIPFE